MGFSSYFKGKKGVIFWLNIILMVAILTAVPMLAFFLLGEYTHHGEKIEVPDVRTMTLKRAHSVLTRSGFNVIVSDSVDTKEVRPGAVFDQSPKPGSEVKSGRIIYLITRYENEALIEMPKLVGAHSYREAKLILANLGFRLTPDSLVDGMEDGLLLGVHQGHKILSPGDMVSKSRPLTLFVGCGVRDSVERDTITEQIEIDPDF